jgi:hypothetical protein
MDSAPSASYSNPVAALGRDDSGLVAYERDSGVGGASVIARPWDGQSFGPEASVTNPALGPTQANSGLFAAADRTGDIAVVFAQGTPGALRISFGGFDKLPAAFAERTKSAWTRVAQTRLKWTLPTDLWGGVSFDVTLDGQPIGSTRLTFLTPPRIADGIHHWQVVAVDRHNQRTAAGQGTVRIDTTAPTAQLKLAGSRKAGKLLRFTVRAADLPPAAVPGAPAPAPIATSGVRRVRVSFGDGSRGSGTHTTHRYRRRGRYSVKVTVSDAAGNVAVLRSRLRIGR